MHHILTKSLLTVCIVLLGGTCMIASAQARNEWVTIKVIFCSDVVPPKLVSEYTGARLLSIKPPVAVFAVPKRQHEAYALLFTTLPYTDLADPALRNHVQLLQQEMSKQQDAFAAIDPNTLIVRFKNPDDKLLQEFAEVFNVSIRHFIAPLEFALVEIPKAQAHIYYTFLRHTPHVAAVDFNTMSVPF